MIDNLFMVVDCSSQLNFSPLTKHRVPGAIPIFAKYRLIDLSLSIAMNEGINNVGIFCDHNYRSLQDHIGSGARYNLDRRRDGIFILPPKQMTPITEDFLSFERMAEQEEYFKRSSQEYVVITPSTLVWRPNFKEIFLNHINSGKDITQVVSATGERLFTFILKKDRLEKYIESYSTISFRNIVEVFDYSNLETKNTCVSNVLSKYLKNINEYYNLQMDLINPINLESYITLNDIRTKEPLDQSTYYSENAKVKNSILATGIYVDGEIYNSYISRRVKIGHNAIVRNSIIMNNVVIGDNAIVENAILDKESQVLDGAIIKGTKKDPFISEKRQIISTSTLKKVAIFTAECDPYVKRGGLSDMVGSLVVELSKIGADLKVFLPLYKEIKKKYINQLEKKDEIVLLISGIKHHISVYSIEHQKLTYYFIDLYPFFDRDEVYGYSDDTLRFSYYTYAAFEFLNKNNIDIDVFHFHDWHASLTPLFMEKYPIYKDKLSILTIHNLNYQGEANISILDEFNLDYPRHSSMFTFLEVGINKAKEITTVSKTYREELMYDYYSGRLKEIITRRKDNLYGIVNGLSNKFNPEIDLEIKAQYNKDTVFNKKEINKKFLMEESGFTYSKDAFIIGSVSRINDIKGFDLLIDALPQALSKYQDLYFVLLGVGDKYLMDRLKEIENNFKSQVKLYLDFNGTNPSYIYSGADAFIMPSKIEPCGTSQLIALKYGTIPIVRQTGGLNDTITSYDPISKNGNGFKFFNSDSRELLSMIEISYNTFKNDKDSWNSLIKNAVNSDYSFKKCAKEYLKIYNIMEGKN